MKFIYKNKTVRIFSLGIVLASIVSFGIFMQGCSNEFEAFYSSDSLDPDIANSPELEEYIIAGTDFQLSMAAFSDFLNKIDFLTLEVTYSAEGKKIIHLPASVGAIGIEKKLNTFNEKKEAFQKKFPRFATFNENTGKRYFQYSHQNSVNVAEKFLELGINTSRPKLKNDSEGTYTNYSGGENIAFMFYILSVWASHPDYKEVYIIAYADGDYGIWCDDNNTSSWSTITIEHQNYTNYKYNGRPISWISHTHKNNSCASTTDMNSRASTPGLDRYIYYQGSFHDYIPCP